MSTHPLSSVYVQHELTRVWSRPGYAGIPYSDGDEPEKRIAEILEQAGDLSSLSFELARQCTDWPARYHLSSARANLLRPFTAALGGDVLEIGAGCGALTRFLGECGGRVLALEGSPRRAAMAAARTRDLAHVTVVAESLEHFEWPAQFDVITLVGVLEYAGLFMHAENPPLAMLQRARALLRPNGTLLLAIENQLGLKYFAGAGEDHTGLPMYGLEGRYRPEQPRTFGRAALADLLRQGGFSAMDFLLPFPDYKLPSSIITAAGLQRKDFDAAAFAWQSACRDPLLPPYRNFALELAWPIVFANGLALDLANSFLVAAAPTAKPFMDPRMLAFHYSTGRQAAYCKEIVFRDDGTGGIQLAYKRLGRGTPPAGNAPTPPLQFVCHDAADYHAGITLSFEFIRLVTTDGWRVEQVAAFLRRYLAVLQTLAREQGLEVDVSSARALVAGTLFDASFRNIIIHPDGKPALIDQEWIHPGPMELGFLLFRTIQSNLMMISRWGTHGYGSQFTPAAFFVAVLDAAGLPVTTDDLRRYSAAEAELQNHIVGYDLCYQELVKAWMAQPLKTQTGQGRVAQLLIECEAQLASAMAQLRAAEDALAARRKSLFGRLAAWRIMGGNRPAS